MLKKIQGVILSTLLILLISFALAEIALRIYDNWWPSYIFHKSNYERFRGLPHSYDWDFQLNSRGYKDVEFSPKQPDGIRLLAIGDSFTFGIVPYQYNYITVLETQLQQQFPQVDVLNMGIPSTNPKDYLALLLKEGLQLKPDIVILSLFLGNDFDETPEKKWYEYSHVLSLFHFIFNIRNKAEGMKIHGKYDYCDTCPSFDIPTYLYIEQSRSHIFIKNDPRFLQSFERVSNYLLQIKKVCEDNNVQLFVVLIPDEMQVNRKLQQQVQQSLKQYQHADWDMTQPNSLLAKFLRQAEIPYVDLYRAFKIASQRQNLYRLRDSHWNIAGNQLAAAELFKYLSMTIQNVRFNSKI